MGQFVQKEREMIRTNRMPLSAIAAMAISIGVSTVSGQTIFVDAAATDVPHDGSSWCHAYLTLPEALEVAGLGDVVKVAEGTYMPDGGYRPVGGEHVPGTGDRLATFPLIHGVTLQGGYAGCGAPDPDDQDPVAHETILSGDLTGDDAPSFANRTDNSYHVCTYDDPSAFGVILGGFTISGGHADGTGPAGTITNQGGAIHIRDGSRKCIPGGPMIRDCSIRDNWAADHGAINDHALASTFENCTFLSNFAGEQGGGLLVHSGSPTVRGCTFVNNATDGDGGAVWTGHDTDSTCSADSQPRFENCTFVGNTSGIPGIEVGHGGGLYNELNEPTVDGCVFNANRSEFLGGGLYNHLTVSALVTNSTFDSNVTRFQGGGMYHVRGIVTISDTLFVGNRAETIAGGGLYADRDSEPTLRRVVFRDNFAFNGGGGMYFVGGFGAGANIADSLFVGNRSDEYGGGFASIGHVSRFTNTFFTANTSLTGAAVVSIGSTTNIELYNCSLVRNSAQVGSDESIGFGGAVSAFYGTIALTNCLVAGNTASNGGAFSASGPSGKLTATNCTIVGNTARIAGGVSASVSVSVVTIRNSILWGNRAVVSPESDVFYFTERAPCTSNNCIEGGWSGECSTNNIASDPAFVDPVGPDGIPGTLDDDYRLQNTSPCVDEGDALDLPADLADVDGDGDIDEPIPVDLAGGTRVLGTGVDMGAYESLASPIPTVSAWGMLALALLVLVAGTVVVRRMKAAAWMEEA